MKKFTLIFAIALSCLFASAQKTGYFVSPFEKDGNTIPYFQDFITTSIYDTLGLDFHSDLYFPYTGHPIIDGSYYLSPMLLNSAMGNDPVFQYSPIAVAQPFYSDTLLQIGAICFYTTDVNYVYPKYTTGDSIFVIDENTLEVLYAQKLNDTLTADGLPYNMPCNFYYIILDSAVSVQGDFLIGYRFNSEHAVAEPNLFNPSLFSFYFTSMYLNFYNNSTDTNAYGKHSKQVYYYNDDIGWQTCSDYRKHYEMPPNKCFLNIELAGYANFTVLYPTTPDIPIHTSDLCVFLIPEYALDSSDLSIRPFNPVDTIPTDTTITDTIPTDTIPTDTTITDSTDTNGYISQIDLERMISVQPNPTKGEVIVSCPEPVREVAILNPMGQVLYREHYNQKRITLDLSTYPQGVYILKIQTSSGEVRKKVVRQ